MKSNKNQQIPPPSTQKKCFLSKTILNLSWTKSILKQIIHFLFWTNLILSETKIMTLIRARMNFLFHETLQSICGLLSVRGKLVLISSSGFCFKFPRLSPLNIGFFAKTPPISRLMLSFSFHSPDYIWLRCRNSTPKKIFSVFRTVQVGTWHPLHCKNFHCRNYRYSLRPLSHCSFTVFLEII